MEFSIGITPENLWIRFLGLCKKFGLRVLSGRPYFVGVIVFIILIILLYRLLDNYLYRKYRGNYEKSI